METIVYLIVLLYSAILHEIAHGAVAEYFGDDTAREAGRISLNPISHIDPYFTILLPLTLVYFGSPVIFGAAKPVPVNYYNLRNFRWGVFWVSVAGVLTNLILAVVFALLMHFAAPTRQMAEIFAGVARINVFLAVVNMVPVPPIDGSKVVAALISESAINKITAIEMRGLIGLIPFILIIYFLFASSSAQKLLLGIANFFLNLFGVGSAGF